MPTKWSRAELEAENRILRRGQRVTAVSSVANRLITVGGFVWIAHYVRDTLIELSGEKTVADIAISFLGHVGVSESLAWIVAILCGGYGIAQRTMRRRNGTRLGKRIRELEQAIDPERSSSELPESGGEP